MYAHMELIGIDGISSIQQWILGRNNQSYSLFPFRPRLHYYYYWTLLLFLILLYRFLLYIFDLLKFVVSSQTEM